MPKVYSPTNFITPHEFIESPDTSIDWQYEEVDLGPDWHWIRVPQLSNQVKFTQNFSFGEPEPWLRWLREN